MKDGPLSDLLVKDSINTDNQLMAFSDSSWKYCRDTRRITGAYMIFCKGVPIDHDTHVTGTAAQSIEESYYNEAYTAVMALANFRMLIHEL